MFSTTSPAASVRRRRRARTLPRRGRRPSPAPPGATVFAASDATAGENVAATAERVPASGAEWPDRSLSDTYRASAPPFVRRRSPPPRVRRRLCLRRLGGCDVCRHLGRVRVFVSPLRPIRAGSEARVRPLKGGRRSRGGGLVRPGRGRVRRRWRGRGGGVRGGFVALQAGAALEERGERLHARSRRRFGGGGGGVVGDDDAARRPCR